MTSPFELALRNVLGRRGFGVVHVVLDGCYMRVVVSWLPVTERGASAGGLPLVTEITVQGWDEETLIRRALARAAEAKAASRSGA